MADVPTSDMTARAARAEPFRQHLERLLRRRVTYFIARDYADLITAFHAQRVHLLNVHTGSVGGGVRQLCADRAADRARWRAGRLPHGNRRAGGLAVARVEDLKARTLTLVDERSASGYKLPRALLEREFQMRAGREYQVNFSGRHDNSIMGVANGLYEAAAVGSAVRTDLLRQKLLDPDSLRVIYTSPCCRIRPGA
ncbi:MAG: PhnD/SsuA/transferrin family substrate-binding protein [Inhella sp.]